MPPNIIIIVADDLGWGDVGFHGSRQVQTPNIDVLAADGIILHNYYVSPICTPSRSALLSGRHPIHTGMQHDVIYSAYPYAFPLQYKLMPQFFKHLGYDTHAVGKWHLGHMTVDHTPTKRGFDSFYGYYSGHQGYTDHTSYEIYDTDNDSWTGWGLDMWNNLEADDSVSGKYTTNVFTEKAIDILKNRNQSKPLFLYLSHLAVHVGNAYALMEAPDQYFEKFPYIKNQKRRTFAAMLAALDDSVGELIKGLLFSNAIKNTIVVFTTDNGGAAGGVDNSAGSNWPLRGSKATLWEGGVRGTAFIWSPLIETPHVAHQMMHITDIMPTLYSAAGGSVSDLGGIDGVDMWESLLKDSASPRTEILHNIDPIGNTSALRYNNYKFVQGSYAGGLFDGWFKAPDTSLPPFQTHKLRTKFFDKEGFFNAKCGASRTIRAIGRAIPIHSSDELKIVCEHQGGTPCHPLKQPCLFDIEADPCEMDNIAKQHPEIMDFMLEKLKKYRKAMAPPLNEPATRKADPRNFNYTWAPYM